MDEVAIDFRIISNGLFVDTLDVNALNQKYQSLFDKDKILKDYKISVFNKYCQSLKKPQMLVETSSEENRICSNMIDCSMYVCVR